MASDLCRGPRCDRPRKYRDYCDSHQRQKRRGLELTEISPRRGASLNERLEYWSMPLTNTGCVVWVGALQSGKDGGYGYLKLGGASRRVHRLTYELHFGPIPDGMLVDHRCGVRSCINPDHLRLATPSQNAAHLTRMSAANTSGHRNVFWHGPSRTWQVLIGVNGHNKSFGMYADIEDAANVARQKRREIYGEFAGIDN